MTREASGPPAALQGEAGLDRGARWVSRVATDAPVGTHELTRARAPRGNRPGANRIGGPPRKRRDLRRRVDPREEEAAGDIDLFFTAVVDATEEAVLNALWAAENTDGRDGRVVAALPHERVLELPARPPGG